MTGGVAHDFNNLLMVIVGNIEMLAVQRTGRRSSDNSPHRAEAARRGGKLTMQLLASAAGRCCS